MYSGHRLAPWLSHVMASEEESQRPLLTPDEALRLPEDSTVVFRAGHRPIYAEKVRYYGDPRLLARASMAVPLVSDRIAQAAGRSTRAGHEPADLASGGRKTPLDQPALTPHRKGGRARESLARAAGHGDGASDSVGDAEPLL